MTTPPITPLQRVLTALSHREPDRVPFFLLLTMHGAKETGLSLRSYFSAAENLVEGQLRLREKFGHDCLYNFFYAALEVEAFGGETIFSEDGPPTAGQPVIAKPRDILSLEPPRVADCACLQKVLSAHRKLKARVGDSVPIIGVVMSPFSLPVMQLGFDLYFDVMLEQPHLFDHLMQINQAFCVEWANAQLDAGATAICYFDPVSSTTIVTRDQYLRTGYQVARQTLAALRGPAAVHFASGRCLPIIDKVAQVGAALVGVSVEDDLRLLKQSTRGQVALMGNLNGIEMRRWSPAEAEEKVKHAIASAGKGGGFILADNHGEIPLQVPDETLFAISAAAQKWGRYPLDWIDPE